MTVTKKSPRQTARELALLGISQLPQKAGILEKKQLQEMLLVAIRTLTKEVEEALEMAAAELQKASDRPPEKKSKRRLGGVKRNPTQARCLFYGGIKKAIASWGRKAIALEIFASTVAVLEI